MAGARINEMKARAAENIAAAKQKAVEKAAERTKQYGRASHLMSTREGSCCEGSGSSETLEQVEVAGEATASDKTIKRRTMNAIHIEKLSARAKQVVAVTCVHAV